MKQFRIKLTKYSEAGAITNEMQTIYYTEIENAKNGYYTYDTMRYENNIKMYKVELSTLAYKKIENATDFFNQFEA